MPPSRYTPNPFPFHQQTLGISDAALSRANQRSLYLSLAAHADREGIDPAPWRPAPGKRVTPATIFPRGRPLASNNASITANPATITSNTWSSPAAKAQSGRIAQLLACRADLRRVDGQRAEAKNSLTQRHNKAVKETAASRALKRASGSGGMKATTTTTTTATTTKPNAFSVSVSSAGVGRPQRSKLARSKGALSAVQKQLHKTFW